VALKQFLFDKISPNEGFAVTALREINTLFSVQRHANIVGMEEVVLGSTLDKVYMVLQYLPHNLRDYIESLQPGAFFTQGEVKCMLQQLLRGLGAMHGRWLVHRDVKSANVLMDNEGRLCLCDFGLARRYGEPLRAYTDTVVTLWYRAPELLLGSKVYGPPVDLWSIGCIFAELLTKTPLFQSSSETAAISDIYKLLGTPRDTEAAPLPSSAAFAAAASAGGGPVVGGLLPGQQTWPGWKSLPLVSQLRAAERTYTAQPFRKALKLSAGPSSYASGAQISESGLDLLSGLLMLDPSQRLTATEALAHPWFREQPLPTDPRLMPAFPSIHGQGKGGKR
jgi:cell division cycle 2-like protein